MQFLDKVGLEALWKQIVAKTNAAKSTVTGDAETEDGLNGKAGVVVAGVEQTDGHVQYNAALKNVYSKTEVDAIDTRLSETIQNLSQGGFKVKKVTTGLGETIREKYQLVDSKNNVVTGSDEILIYKDSSFKGAKLVSAGDKIDESDESAVTEDTLVLTYIDVNGADTNVPIPLGSFLSESEFGNGLEVNNHVVSVKKDTTATENYLSVSANGVKVDGIDAAIESAKSELKGTKAAGDETPETIAGAKAYADAAVAGKNVSANGDTLVSAAANNNTVTVGATAALTSAVANANSALQSISVAKGAEDFLTIPAKSEGATTQTVGVKTKTVASATSEANGLATAADVKSYVDEKTGEGVSSLDATLTRSASVENAPEGSVAVITGFTLEEVDGKLDSTSTVTSTAVDPAGTAKTLVDALRGEDATRPADTLAAVRSDVETLKGSGTGSVSDQINTAINALDATVTKSATGTAATNNGVFVVSGITIDQQNGKLIPDNSSVTSVEVDPAGAAATAEQNAKDYTNARESAIRGAGTGADTETLTSLRASINDITSGANSVDNKIKTAIEALDADESADATGTAQNAGEFVVSGVQVVETDGKITSVAVTSKEVEKAGAAAAAKTAAKAYTDSKLDALDNNDAEVDGQFVVAAVQENGAVTVSRKAVAADKVTFASSNENFTATTVKSALDTLYAQSGTGSAVTMTESTGTGDAGKTYTFYQGGEDASHKIGEINIPKDLVLKSGVIETVEGVPHLKLTLNDADETVIDVNLNDVFNDYEAGDSLELSNRKFNVVVDPTSEAFLAIDGNTKKIKLSGVQTAINAALTEAKGYTDTKIQALDADLDAVKESTDANAVAVVSGVVEVDGKITAIDSVDVDKAGAATTAEANAKAYADTKVADLAVKASGEDSSTGLVTASIDANDNKKVVVASTQKLQDAVSLANTALQSVDDTQKGSNVKVTLGVDSVDTKKVIVTVDETALNTALANKVDKETGKGLSTNDFTDAYKNQLDSLNSDLEDAIKVKGVTVNNASVVDTADKIAKITIAEGATNGSIAVNGADVAVHGLNTAAYQPSTAFDAAGSANTVKTELLGDASGNGNTLGKLEDRLETLEGDGEGSVADQIADAVNELDATVDANLASGEGIVPERAGVTEAQGAWVLTKVVETDGKLVATSSEKVKIEAIPESALTTLFTYNTYVVEPSSGE